VLALLLAGVFGYSLALAQTSCSNPSPMPSGYAAPCPVFAVSPASVSQSGTLTLSASPQPGTDYIYTTAYYAQGQTWIATTLQGNNAAPSYSSGPATGSLNASILSTLPTGTNYVVLWDWLWDASAGCYKGPGLNQCNTGTWRLQTFNLTSTPALSITASITSLISGGFLTQGPTCGFLNIFTNASTVYIPSTYTPRVGDTVQILGNGSCATSVTATQVAGPSVSSTSTPSPTAGINNYYIATNGSDSNSCVQSSPCATINHVDSILTLGTNGIVVHVAPGIYTGLIATNKSGTATQRIQYVSDTRWGAKLVGNSGAGTHVWQPSGSFVDINGFVKDPVL